MKWKLITVGKPSLDYAKRGMAEYLKRLSRYVRLDHSMTKEAGKATNSERLMELAGDCDFVIALDERGEELTTDAFTKLIDAREMAGTKRIALIIGGADGHSEALRSKADRVIRLSKMTMQHELALVVLLEQLYRAYTIKRGEPYHR